MYKRIFSLLCFCLSFQLFAQEIKIKADILFDDFSANLLKTSDVLHIVDNPDKYLMNKSPLSHFDGYRSIYSEDQSTIIVHGEPFIIGPSPPPYGSSGNSEKEYMATWLLLNSQLYLCNVDFPFELKRDDKIVYRPMEKLTGKRFKRKNIPDIEIGKWIYGLMPADWFTDTLYVKKANTEKDSPYRSVWQRKHYLRIIFNKGELVSTETVENKTWIETLTWPRSGKEE